MAATGLRPAMFGYAHFVSVEGSASGMSMITAPLGNVTSASKRSCCVIPRVFTLCVLAPNGRHRPRNVGVHGPIWSGSTSIACLLRSTRWALSAEALSTLLETDPQTSVREALGDL